MIRGSAATVAGLPVGWLCMRITGCCCDPPACASETIRSTHICAPDPPAFQSSVSTDHSHTDIRRCNAALRVLVLYSPYGGRNRHDGWPVTAACVLLVRSISTPCADALRLGMLGWLHVWLPNAAPTVAWARASPGRTLVLTP